MASRKQTPDVLSEILGGEPASSPSSAPQPQEAPLPSRVPTAARRAPATATGRSTARKSAWEYMEVIFHDYGGYRPRCINGQEQTGWKRLPLILEYLNQLGEQGWELAGMGGRENGELPAYFKRPK